MLRARLLEKRLAEATHTSEAVLAGTLENVADSDLIVSSGTHPVLEILRGRELSRFTRPSKDHAERDHDKVIASTPDLFASLAGGLAFAARRSVSDSVVIAIAPGKLTTRSTFTEATQFAALRRLPLVILADWTDSRQCARSHEGRDLSHWPLPTIAVDGRDVIAVYRVTKEAISAARRGHGPTLVDCVNFLAPGRRGRDERDPLLSYRGYLQRHNAWSDLWHSELESRYKAEIRAVGMPRGSKTRP